MSTTAWQPAPKASKSGGALRAIVGVVIVLAAGGLLYFFTRGGAVPDLPATLLGQARATSADAKSIEKSMHDEIAKTDAVGDAVVYGTGATPEFLVAAYQEPASITFDEEYGIFTEGFTSTGGALDTAGQKDGTSGEWTIRCVPLQDAPASVCVSGKGRVFIANVFLTTGDSAEALTKAQDILTELVPAN